MKRSFPNTSVAGDPERARHLILQLWSALELVENLEVSRRELSGYLGLSESSLGDWLQGETALHQVEAVLRLFERVPGRWRREVLRAFVNLGAGADGAPLMRRRPNRHPVTLTLRLASIEVFSFSKSTGLEKNSFAPATCAL